jgi:hypothetical protein
LIQPRGVLYRAFLVLALTHGLASPGFAQFETRTSSLVSPQPGPLSVATGDFNHDGRLDAVVASAYEIQGRNSTEVQVLLGNGDGTFKAAVNYRVGQAPDSVAAADVNHDGNSDIVVADSASDTVSVLLGNGDGTFQPAVSFPVPQNPTFVAVGDFNNDGKIDIATVNGSDATGYCDCVAVLLGNGDGTFQEPPIITSLAAPPTSAFGVGRFRAGGNLDIAVSEESEFTSQVEILIGNGDGSFRSGSTYEVGSGPGAVAVADFNGDSHLDLAVSENEEEAIGVLLGNGDGTFQPEVRYGTNFPLWVTAADLTGDGTQDLVVANLDFSSGVSTLKGNGDGTFQSGVYYPDGAEDRFVAVGDFNGDKKPDIVVLDFLYSKAIVLLNTGTVTFSPTTPVNFKKQAVGTKSAAQKIILTNTGKTELKISSMKASAQFGVSSTCGASVAGGANCTISVTFSPKTQGVKSGTVTINDSASSKPQVIELSGTGT